jgi:thioredoxin-like negative regulator of GroEL
MENKKNKYKSVSDFNFKDIDPISVVVAHMDSCPDCELTLKFLPLFHDKATLYLLDVDVEEDLATSLDVAEVPHILFIRNGQVVGNLWGYQEPNTVTAWINFHADNCIST